MINNQIEEQQKVLDELNHKVLLKENELGVSRLKELQTKLENAEKQLSHLSQKILEKDKIISELKEENKKLKSKKEKFENLDIIEHICNLEFIGMLTCKPIEEGKDKDSEENKILKEKIKKMKDAINELTTKLEKELLIKEKKNIKINENNSKLFENLQKKNKELMKMLKQENLQNMALRKEKYDLETICIKQEDTIRNLNKQIKSHSKKKKLHQIVYSYSNILTQNDGLPKISNSPDTQSNHQFTIHNKSSFLPSVK